jgi:solute carrier family 25 (peroxisomal adenine nucleotide transporter), member 17
MTSTLPPLVQAVSGSIGSVSANIISYPLDLVTSRLQLERHPTTKSSGLAGGTRILRRTIKKDGWTAIYDGLFADTTATFLSKYVSHTYQRWGPNLYGHDFSFLYFYFYSFLRNSYVERMTQGNRKPSTTAKLPVIQELLLGFISGIASRAVSTPLNIITLRLQTERQHYDSEEEEEKAIKSSSSSGIVLVGKQIYKENGLAGFWQGVRFFTFSLSWLIHRKLQQASKRLFYSVLIHLLLWPSFSSSDVLFFSPVHDHSELVIQGLPTLHLAKPSSEVHYQIPLVRSVAT